MMHVIVYLGIWIVNLIYVIRKKTNRLISVCSYILLAILFVSNAGTTGDAELYKLYFEKRLFTSGMFEVGYTFFEKTLHLLGVHTYTGLLISLFVIGSLFLWIGVKNLDVSYHHLFAIIMPFIFPTYATAIRFFFASTIMIAAIRYLSEKKYFIFVLLTILAGFFHLISLFYLLFVVCGTTKMVKQNNNKRLRIWIVGFISIASFTISIVAKTNPVVMALVRIVTIILNVGDNKLEAYATSYVNMGGVMFMLIYLIGLFVAVATRRFVNKGVDGNLEYEKEMEFIRTYADINCNINIMLSVALLFIAMNIIFYRLMIIGQISNSIAIGMYLNKKRTKTDNKTIRIEPMTALFVLSCISWFIPELIEVNSITIQGIFESSLLF